VWYHPVVHFTLIIPNDKSLFKVIGNTSYIISITKHVIGVLFLFSTTKLFIEFTG